MRLRETVDFRRFTVTRHSGLPESVFPLSKPPDTVNSWRVGTYKTMNGALAKSLIALLLAGLICSLLPMPARAAAEPDFTLVVLPDTQYYAKDYPGTLKAQVDWIIANRTRLNIVYVAHVGDVVDSSKSRPQWENAAKALNRLEDPTLTGLPDGIPFGVVPGNHDHAGPGEAKFFNQYFGVPKFEKKPWYGGHFGSTNNSHFDRFSAGGTDFVVVHVDFRTADKKTNAENAVGYVVAAAADYLAKKTDSVEKIDFSAEDAWADGVLKANANRRAILVTHCAVNAQGQFNQRGRELYDHLKNNPNLFLILCGHVAGEAQRADIFQGRTIHSCLADYQKEANGGDGWLRLYQFSPANHRIAVRTYSPTLNKWRTNPASQFNLDYAN